MDDKRSLILVLLIIIIMFIIGMIFGIAEGKRTIARDGYFTHNKITYKIVALPKINERKNEK